MSLIKLKAECVKTEEMSSYIKNIENEVIMFLDFESDVYNSIIYLNLLFILIYLNLFILIIIYRFRFKSIVSKCISYVIN